MSMILNLVSDYLEMLFSCFGVLIKVIATNQGYPTPILYKQLIKIWWSYAQNKFLTTVKMKSSVLIIKLNDVMMIRLSTMVMIRLSNVVMIRFTTNYNEIIHYSDD